ncbi:TIGR00730 family Rossman fold protein [Salinicoccus albus]|uniref:LOG family protein n=1 Tax=Salinicoccus albus TaxID=418756 RepID=UPI00036E195F|nr:TIGR00730 family Rossman fold protein [Salinicoccus albus]
MECIILKLENVTVFCGSHSGSSAVYEKSAFALGAHLAKENIGIVYGGGSIGLMGALADGALSEGGSVTGVIPQFLLDREMGHPKLTHLEVVTSMHKRKERMEALGDAFITLPGGAGTLEEFFEIFTWGQIGLHKKPIGLLNVNHFYDEILQLFNKLIDESFLHQAYVNQLFTGADGAEILDQFKFFEPVDVRTYADINRRQS